MDQPKPSNKLVMPEGVSSLGPVQDITEAYVKASIAVPELLVRICDELAGMNDSLSLLALYAERKGLEEKLITQDDLDKGDDDGKAETA